MQAATGSRWPSNSRRPQRQVVCYEAPREALPGGDVSPCRSDSMYETAARWSVCSVFAEVSGKAAGSNGLVLPPL